jgi:hypothetical protein
MKIRSNFMTNLCRNPGNSKGFAYFFLPLCTCVANHFAYQIEGIPVYSRYGRVPSIWQTQNKDPSRFNCHILCIHPSLSADSKWLFTQQCSVRTHKKKEADSYSLCTITHTLWVLKASKRSNPWHRESSNPHDLQKTGLQKNDRDPGQDNGVQDHLT